MIVRDWDDLSYNNDNNENYKLSNRKLLWQNEET